MVEAPTVSGKHPSSAVLLDHAADTLDVAHRLIVETHILRCQACEETVLFFREIGSTLTARLPIVEPPSDLLERCISSLEAKGGRRSPGRIAKSDTEPRRVGDTVLPPSLKDLRPTRLRLLAPGLRHSTLWRDERSTLHFIRAEAGVTLPAHSHRGLELTCVLSGAFRDHNGVHTIGDVAEEEDDDSGISRRDRDHLVRAEPQGRCECVMATTGRLRFSGWLARLLQPVMPF